MALIREVGDKRQAILDSILKERKQLHETRVKYIHGLRRLRFMRNQNKPPRQLQAILGKESPSLPLAFKHVQNVVGAIARHRPVPHLIMRDDNDDETKFRGAQWCDLVMQQQERMAGKPLYWKWVDNVIADGMGVFKLTRHQWKDFPEPEDDETDESYAEKVEQFYARKNGPPFRLRTVEPHTIFLPQYEWEPQDIMEISTRSLRETVRALRVVPTNQSLKSFRVLGENEPYPEDEVPNIPAGTVEVAEIWTPDMVAFGLMGKWFTMDNPYNGIVPYVTTGGATTGSSDPALEYVSTLFPFQRSQPFADMMVSSMIGWAILSVNPIIWTRRRPGPGVTGSQEVAIEEIHWGKHMDLGVGGELGVATVPDVGPSIRSALEIMVELMDRSSLSPAASGYAGTRTAGLAIAEAVDNALGQFAGTMDNMQNGISELYKKMFSFVELGGGPTYASGFVFEDGKGGKRKQAGLVKWGPEDVDATLDILAEVKKESLQELISKGTHAAFMRDKALWTQERSMLFSGVEDTRKEEIGILRDMVKKHPIVQQYLAGKAIADEQPLAALYQQALEAEQGGAPPEEPQGGGGGGGGAPVQRAPQRGGRPKGSSSAIPRGPNRTNPQAGRRVE